jgi:hypothetical protein
MEKIKRKYFEIWGDLEAQNNALRLFLFGLLFVLACSLLVIYLITVRPPAVIRVSEVGKAEAVKDYPSENTVTKPEIMYFTKLFIRKFTEYNSYTIASDLAEAFDLMTANYQKVAKREMIDSKLISKISESAIQTQVEIQDIKVEREDKNFAALTVLGLRRLQSYQNRDFKEESLFKGDIILKKVPRTMKHPHGLLVEEYREVMIKQIEKQ